MTWSTHLQQWLRRSSRLTAMVVAGVILAACAMAFWAYRNSARALREASAQLTECRRLADEMRRLEALPTFAAIDADSPNRIAERIESALQRAKLPETAILRIQPPSQPVRLGETPYQVYETRIELQQVNLAQLAEFAYYLGDAENGLAVVDLRVWTPQRDRSPVRELWSVEITLTQLAFSPKNR